MNAKNHPPSVTNNNREHSDSSSPFEPLDTQEPTVPGEHGRMMVPEMEDDNSSDLFHPLPFPLNLANGVDPDLLSQEVSQSTPKEQGAGMLQPHVSTAHTSTNGLSVLSESNTSLSASLQSSNCTPLSSMCSSYPDLNSTLDTLLSAGKSTPSIDDYITDLSFFVPFPLGIDLQSQEMSQSAPKDQAVDILQFPTSTAPLHLCGADSISALPTSDTNLSASLQCSDSAPPSNEDPSFPFLLPLSFGTDLQSQEMSQSASKEQEIDMVQVPTPLHLPGTDIVSTSDTGLSVSLQCSDSVPPSIDDLSFLFPLPLTFGTDLQSQEMSQSTTKDLQLPTSTGPLHLPGPTPDSSLSASPHSNNSAPPFSTFSSDSVNNVQVLNDERVEVGMSEMGGYGVDLPFLPLPLCADLLPQRMSHSREKERDLQREKSDTEKRVASEMGVCTSTDFPVHSSLPADLSDQSGLQHSSLLTQSCRVHSPQSSYLSQPEDDTQCMHINPDAHYTLTEPLPIQSASQQTMVRLPSPFDLKKNPLTEVSCSEIPPQLCSETPSQMKANLTVKIRSRSNEKQSLIKTAKKERKRKLNKISSVHYRQKKKEEQSILEERREQLEAENLRLKEQVSALIAEIADLKQSSQKTQKKKSCSFFLFSTATSE